MRSECETFLDVGAGTGRGMCFLRDRGKDVRGIEPVTAMIEKAELNGVPRGSLLQGSGYELPFEDEAFDAVFECGVLHHVAEPRPNGGRDGAGGEASNFLIRFESVRTGCAMLRDCSRRLSIRADYGAPLDSFRQKERCTPYPRVMVSHTRIASSILTISWLP